MTSKEVCSEVAKIYKEKCEEERIERLNTDGKLIESPKVTTKDIEKIFEIYKNIVTDVLKMDPNEIIVLPHLGRFKCNYVKPKTGTIHVGKNKGKIWRKPARNDITFVVSENVKNLDDI